MRPFLLLLLLLLAACAPVTDDPPPAEVLDLHGDYTLVFEQANTDCLPPDYLFTDVFGFLDAVEGGTPVTPATFVQNGSELEITLESNGCVLGGRVGEAGSFNAEGACDDELMNRYISMLGDASRSGVDGWSIAATAVFDIDRDDGYGGDPDGVTDCSVTEVNVHGTGRAAR